MFSTTTGLNDEDNKEFVFYYKKLIIITLLQRNPGYGSASFRIRSQS
jgi:hypothetical protein